MRLGFDFRLCSEGDFLTGRPQSVLISIQYLLLTLYIVLIVLAGSITLASMCFSMYCYLYNTQTDCLRLLRELTFNKKEWKIGQVWTCWERFTYPIFYPFAFSRVRIFVHQIEFLVVSQVYSKSSPARKQHIRPQARE